MAPLPVPRSTRDGLRRRDRAQRVDGELRHLLGLRPRDEHPGPDGQFERAERRPAGDVLQRLARGPAFDEPTRTRSASSAEIVRIHDDQGLDAAPALTEDVADQQLGIHLRVGDARASEHGHRLVAESTDGGGMGWRRIRGSSPDEPTVRHACVPARVRRLEW